MKDFRNFDALFVRRFRFGVRIKYRHVTRDVKLRYFRHLRTWASALQRFLKN